jgi:hypothetical protein
LCQTPILILERIFWQRIDVSSPDRVDWIIQQRDEAIRQANEKGSGADAVATYMSDLASCHDSSDTVDVTGSDALASLQDSDTSNTCREGR